MQKVNILGTEYAIEEKFETEDKYLEKCDGYCDRTSRRIVIKKEDDKNELDDFEVYRKAVVRHEIIHAFLHESGLHQNLKNSPWGHDETMIDWFATQFEKMQEAFKSVGAV